MTTSKLNLKQYINKKKEIALIENEILSLYPHEFVRDIVSTGDDHRLTIDGYASNKIPTLLNRKAKLLRDCALIESFVNSIDDSLLRSILILKYLKGFSWTKTALTVGGNNTPDSLRMISSRFLNNTNASHNTLPT